jgi:uncharacterized radical SAM superfamily Fe-S cluster-containing enzyme
MECTSCDSTPLRKDRTHTFFMHEMAVCASCSTAIESRVVLRDDGVVRLIHCNQCGPSEQFVSSDAKAYVAGFLARGEVVPGETGDHLFKHTTSTCPGCLALLPADVVIRDGKVYFLKDCAKCGPSGRWCRKTPNTMWMPIRSRAPAPSR